MRILGYAALIGVKEQCLIAVDGWMASRSRLRFGDCADESRRCLDKHQFCDFPGREAYARCDEVERNQSGCFSLRDNFLFYKRRRKP